MNPQSARWRSCGRAAALLVVVGMLATPTAAQALVTPASTAPANRTLSLVLPLRADRAGLARFATAVNTPSSPLYRDYEPIGWLARRFGASAATRAAVVSFLRRHGARGVRIDATGLYADARLSVGQAQQLFATSLSARRVGHASYTVPATAVRLPRQLRGLVTGVLGLDTEPVYGDPQLATALPSGPRSHDSTTCQPGTGSGGSGLTGTGGCDAVASSGYAGPDGAPAGCAAGLTPNGFAPNQYLTAYQFQPLQQTGIRGQGERVALVEIDGFNLSDIDTFAQCFGLNVPPIEAYGVGLRHLLPAGGEATLDVEVLDAAAPRLKAIDVYEAQPDAVHVLQALTAPLQQRGYKPNVISVSLGLCESATLSGIGSGGMRATEAVLQEATASGISVLAASGDSGSAGCLNTTSATAQPVPQLAVIYPASSPWVTAVGGTNLDLDSQNQIVSQVVWNDATLRPGLAGGGGLSTLFARPRYQDGVVSANQRALPDLALLADVSPGYDVYCTAQKDCDGAGWVSFGGTSAATPLLAGGFALVDQLLRERLLQPLGLANPLLYRLATQPPASGPVTYDVSTGSNDVGPFIQSSGAALGCCDAAAGFDEASGWGGINLAQFAADAEVVQPPVGTVALSVPSQHAVAAGRMLSRVRCTRRCDVIVRIKISGAGEPAFTDYSSVEQLAAHARQTVEILFTSAQELRMSKALDHHRTLSESVTAALVDPSGNIESQSTTLSAPLTS